MDVTICDSDLSSSSVIVTLDSHKKLLHTHSVKGKEKNEITLDNIPSCCQFSLNGKKLAIGFKNGTVQVINLLFDNSYLPQTTLLKISLSRFYLNKKKNQQDLTPKTENTRCINSYHCQKNWRLVSKLKKDWNRWSPAQIITFLTLEYKAAAYPKFSSREATIFGLNPSALLIKIKRGSGEGFLVKNREFRGYSWSFLYLTSFGTVSNATSKKNSVFLKILHYWFIWSPSRLYNRSLYSSMIFS